MRGRKLSKGYRFYTTAITGKTSAIKRNAKRFNKGKKYR